MTKKIISGIDPPNYTQVPNELFAIFPQMAESEIKIVLAIVRETFGWHRADKQISFSEFEHLTGLTRKGVSLGLKAALIRGTIKRSPDGQGFSYSLNIKKVVNEVHQPENQLVNEVHRSSERSTPEVVNEVHQPYKEEINIKERVKKGSVPTGTRARSAVSPDDLSFFRRRDELMDYLKSKLNGHSLGDMKKQRAVALQLVKEYTNEECIAEFERQQKDKWRQKVDWATVRQQIAHSLARGTQKSTDKFAGAI